MKITIQQSNQLKAIAILMMLCLHLFNRDYIGLFQPLIFILKKPLIYYLSLFCDACVPIFAFVTGYGLYYKYILNKSAYKNDNINRIKKIYINYWIILFLFAIVLGLMLGKEGYPGGLIKILLNITGLDPSYNGAWWFFSIYIFFVFTSDFWFRLIDIIKPARYFLILLIVYLLSFYFRVYKVNVFDNEILNWFYRQFALYFCTLFQFMLGAFALKCDWNKRVSSIFKNLKFKNWIIIFLILGLIVFHAFVPNFIIAPFTALVFIYLFIQMDLPEFLENTLDFFANHATNMWLTHMFFYIIYFSGFVYSFQYVPLIFIVLVLLCVLSSYLINFINTILQKYL